MFSKQYDNEAKYDAHIEKIGPRINRDAYNKNKDFQDKGREYNASAENGTLIDSYTGCSLTSHDKFDREHIVPVYEIEKDAGRVLADIDGTILASADSNLAPVNPSVNRSKKEKSVREYIAWLDANRETHTNELSILARKGQEGLLSDKERKRKEKLERICSVDHELMLRKDESARRDYNKKFGLKWYLGKEFLSQTGKETFKASWRMGSRQALGLIFMEVWKALRAEWPHIMETWRRRDGWREKLDIRPVLQHVRKVIIDAVAAVRVRWKDVFSEMKDGFLSGALSALTTTIINIFKTTARNIMRLVRNFWSSIVGALRIMKSNEYATRDEKTLAVMRLLSVAVAGILQLIITECVGKFLSPYVPFEMLRYIISEFAGAFCSGIVSVTLVYFIFVVMRGGSRRMLRWLHRFICSRLDNP